ncbi:MAG: oxygenase MpaB family protein [Agriterribacter sp.]
MQYFVQKDSIVRKIWGRADTVLFIFAGAAAQFSLNKAVEWLYFTGKLPADPIGRLFSTVSYARHIIFSEKEKALAAIARMKSIHTNVENARGHAIPDWAYREVLFMLIYYSVASFELLERTLTDEEKEEVLRVFYEVGTGMGIPQLPVDYKSWLIMHERQLTHNLEKSQYSVDLYKQYRTHLGSFRYYILLQVQSVLTPPQVINLLSLQSSVILRPLILLYKVCRHLNIENILQRMLLPSKYRDQLKELNTHGAANNTK